MAHPDGDDPLGTLGQRKSGPHRNDGLGLQMIRDTHEIPICILITDALFAIFAALFPPGTESYAIGWRRGCLGDRCSTISLGGITALVRIAARRLTELGRRHAEHFGCALRAAPPRACLEPLPFVLRAVVPKITNDVCEVATQ